MNRGSGVGAPLPEPGPLQRGAMVGALDEAMAAAVRDRAGIGVEAVVTDLHTAFLRPAHGPVAASARVTGGGRVLCFCEAEARDAAGRVVATAMGTYRIRPKATVEESPCT